MKLYFAQKGWAFNPKMTTATVDSKALFAHCDAYKQDHSYEVPDKFAMWGDILYRDKSDAVRNMIASDATECVIPQTGNTEGWGVSKVSMKRAKELAIQTAADYALEQQRAADKESKSILAKIKKLQKLSDAQLKQPVHFYFKQDTFMGNGDTFKGKMPLRHLVNCYIGWLTEDDGTARDEAFEKLCTETNISSDVDFSMTEMFGESSQNMITKLLRTGKFSSCGEEGYQAVSMKSVSEAKQLVCKLVLKWEMGDD